MINKVCDSANIVSQISHYLRIFSIYDISVVEPISETSYILKISQTKGNVRHKIYVTSASTRVGIVITQAVST